MARAGSSLAGKVIYSLALAVVVYLGLAFYAGFGELRIAAQHFSWGWFPLVLAFAFTNYLIRFLKWQYYLRVLKLEVPWRESLLIHFAGFSLSITPGKLGEVIKSYFLKKGYDFPVAQTAPIVLADRATDMLALVILTAIGAASFHHGQRVIWVVAVIILVLVGLVGIRPVGEALVRLVCRIPGLHRHEQAVWQLYESSYILLRPQRLVVPLLLAIVAWSCESFAFYTVFQGLHLTIPLLSAIFIYSFSTIVGAVAMLPGGLGVTEGSLTALLRVVAVPEATAALATMLVRVATLWFAVILGTICLIRAERRFDVQISELTGSNT